MDKTLKNHVLESNEPKLVQENANRSGSFKDIEMYRRHCDTLFGNDIMPAVFYKGRVIPEGRLGERELLDA